LTPERNEISLRGENLFLMEKTSMDDLVSTATLREFLAILKPEDTARVASELLEISYSFSLVRAILTPAKAKLIAQLTKKHFRKINPAAVKKLKTKIEPGDFGRGNVWTIVVNLDGKLATAENILNSESFLADANHRTQALSETSVTLPIPVHIILCNSDEEA